MNIIGEYINFKLNSKGKHKIHSPYVFDFVTKCLTTKLEKDDWEIIQAYTSELQSNQQKIEIEDFGAGSKKLGEIRKISQIYSNASAKGVYAKLLHQLSRNYDFKQVLELGTSLGVGTLHLALGNKNAQIHTIDACKNTQDIAKNMSKKFGLGNIHFHHDNFTHFFETGKLPIFDFVYIDGHHDGLALMDYIKKAEPFTHDETIFLLDDIRWSDSMFESWKKLISDERFHLSLDLFRMGILVKRQHQAKEHFQIRLKGILKGMI